MATKPKRKTPTGPLVWVKPHARTIKTKKGLVKHVQVRAHQTRAKTKKPK